MLVVVSVRSMLTLERSGGMPPQENFEINFRYQEIEFWGIFGGFSCQ